MRALLRRGEHFAEFDGAYAGDDHAKLAVEHHANFRLQLAVQVDECVVATLVAEQLDVGEVVQVDDVLVEVIFHAQFVLQLRLYVVVVTLHDDQKCARRALNDCRRHAVVGSRGSAVDADERILYGVVGLRTDDWIDDLLDCFDASVSDDVG